MKEFKWNRTDYKLPEDESVVYVWVEKFEGVKYSFPDIATFKKGEKLMPGKFENKYLNDELNKYQYIVTHWSYIPEPKEENEDE